MARNFQIPEFYRSSFIRTIKTFRERQDPRRKDFSPSLLDFGPVRFSIGRHFGFCFGVENAIEIAYRALSEHPERRIFLLSEMIHNPEVNADLSSRGVQFLMNTNGEKLVDFSTLQSDDIVIVPAFGTTLELCAESQKQGLNPQLYNTTCPFVEKVWKRAADLGAEGYTVLIHGKKAHEETRATFSHSKESAPTLVVRDMEETLVLTAFIRGQMTQQAFYEYFSSSVSEGFDPQTHLIRVGVVNQTTMLASETRAIAQTIRNVMLECYGVENIKFHFADTRDTLCYATQENQTATQSLIRQGANLGLVVGGYNSSNTSHLVELLEQSMPTFYIKGESEITGRHSIRHFCLASHSFKETADWLPDCSLAAPLTIALTSGASCPDVTVDRVIQRVVGLIPGVCNEEVALQPFLA